MQPRQYQPFLSVEEAYPEMESDSSSSDFSDADSVTVDETDDNIEETEEARACAQDALLVDSLLDW